MFWFHALWSIDFINRWFVDLKDALRINSQSKINRIKDVKIAREELVIFYQVTHNYIENNGAI